MTRIKIATAFQTTLSAKVIRALGLRPGVLLSPFVEGNRVGA